jgi:hypothetical protein
MRSKIQSTSREAFHSIFFGFMPRQREGLAVDKIRRNVVMIPSRKY